MHRWIIHVLLTAAAFGILGLSQVRPEESEARPQDEGVDSEEAALTREVVVGEGAVRGERSGDGTVAVFRGVPYAAPPVGDLRWRPPQPAAFREGVLECTAFSPVCPQPKQILFRDVRSTKSEDCLTLNIWTPARALEGAGRKKREPLPVMAWIHGGGFTTGAGSHRNYDGTALACRGAVVVTINYRLGPFGFFAHPLLSEESAEGVSGNYGLLDQIAALEWVRDNIAAFGGDPRCVTIFGESAGSVSVCLLMVSPLAKGLFHRAIAQSGGVHTRHRYLSERRCDMTPGEELGERLVAKLGCDSAEDVLAALRKKSAATILEKANPAQGLFGKGMKFGPVVDGWVLPDDPGVLFNEGKQHDVPMLIGTNADEGSIFIRQLPAMDAVGYRELVRSIVDRHGDAVLELFPAERDRDVKDVLNKLITASAFVAPARALARSMEKVRSKAWLYHFTRVPPLAKASGHGAFHGLEILYVFDGVTGRIGYDRIDRALADRMSAAWVRFAARGDPNGSGLPCWLAYTARKDRHMEFGETIRSGKALCRDACDLVDTIQEERLRTDRGQ